MQVVANYGCVLPKSGSFGVWPDQSESENFQRGPVSLVI
jgi:hypothetical protein